MTHNKQLREAAEAATSPSPWFESEGAYVMAADNSPVWSDEGICSNRDAAFIAAANPSVVLELLDRIDELEAAKPTIVDDIYADVEAEHLDRLKTKVATLETEAATRREAEAQASDLGEQVLALTAERDALREALKPFAKEGARIPASGQDDVRYEAGCDGDACPIYSLFTVGDLRRAAKAGGTE